MSNNAEKIAQLRAEADKLEAADKAFSELSEEHRMAITLHGLLCHWNHVDGCSWEYESDKNGINWNGYAHNHYLGKAKLVMKFCSCNSIASDQAIGLLKLLDQ